MGKYRVRVAVQIIGEDGNLLYSYATLLRSGGKILWVKTWKSANNIVKTMVKDVRKICLVD